MRFPPLLQARFVRRLNRFAATVSLDGHEVTVHVANSGRMRELLQPGALCYLTEQPGPHRKTGYDLALVAIDRVHPGSVGERPAAYAADSAPPGANAAAMSSYRMVSDTGYVIGPILLGWLGDLHGLDAPLWVSAVALVAIAVLFGALAAETHRRA